MAALIEGAGVELAVHEQGSGPAVLLIHDIGSDAADLRPLATALAGRARVISFDRRGYGGSGAPEPYEATTVAEQAQDAACVLTALDAAPALVCGLGFGALVALDLATRRRELVASLLVADAPLFAFVAEAAAALAGERLALETALREEGPELAVERWLGPGADPERVRRARAAHRAFFADVAGLASWPVTRATLRGIEGPVPVLTSDGARPHVVAAADALAGLVPGSRREHHADLATSIGAALRA